MNQHMISNRVLFKKKKKKNRDREAFDWFIFFHFNNDSLRIYVNVSHIMKFVDHEHVVMNATNSLVLLLLFLYDYWRFFSNRLKLRKFKFVNLWEFISSCLLLTKIL